MKTTKTTLRLFGLLLLAAALVCLIIGLYRCGVIGGSLPDTAESAEKTDSASGESGSDFTTARPVASDTSAEKTSADSSESDTSSAETSAGTSADSSIDESTDSSEAEIPWESPVDFEALQEENPHIYGWIRIEDTKVDYPVVQHPNNDSYYLNRDSKGSYYIGGAIFSESAYNSRSFEDPAVLLYGHTMRAGTMFGQLQAVYSDPDTFASHNEISVYTPEREYRYQVFAAVPYDSRHILYTYDFSIGFYYDSFIDSIFSVRSIGACFDQSVQVETGDRLLVLSTCMTGNANKRFLVIGVLTDDLEDNRTSES